MFNIKYFLVDHSEVTGFELGGIEINLNESKFVLTDQKHYFMVFLSILDFADMIIQYSNSKTKRIKGIFADSSFFIEIERVNKEMVNIYIMNKFFGETNYEMYLNGVYEASKNFYYSYKNELKQNKALTESIEMALRSMLEYKRIYSDAWKGTRESRCDGR